MPDQRTDGGTAGGQTGGQQSGGTQTQGDTSTSGGQQQTQTGGGTGGQTGQTGSSGTQGQTTTGGTILDDKGGKTGAGGQQGTEGQQGAGDWRTPLAEGLDKTAADKRMALLNRYGSQKDVIQALEAAQAKLSSGNLKQALPKDATPEQVTEWRKENGIPEAADKYDVKLPNNMVIGDYDKPFVDDFLKTMHANNMSNEQANHVLGKYYEIIHTQTEQRFGRDADLRDKTISDLSREWGSEYQPNLNMIKGLLDTMGPELADQFAHGRLSNGEALMNWPPMARWLNQMARTINPVETLVPGATNQSEAIGEEIVKLQKMMGDKNSEYWKGANADKNQARFRELTSAQERLKKKTG